MNLKKEHKMTQVGGPMNFRGFMYQPINEQGVVYLFGLVAEDLNIRVESIQQGYPDCTALRYRGDGRWERIRIEFEHKSSNFDHDPAGCDVIVCWEDDLKETEKEKLKTQGVEIIELKAELGGFSNPPLEDPDKTDVKEQNYELIHHIPADWIKTRNLFEELDKRIKDVNSAIWRKITKTSITYYSPEKVFIYMHPQKQGIKLYLFTNAEKVEGVIFPYADALKWGSIHLKDVEDLDKVVNAVRKAYTLINYAINKGLNTGWFAIPENLGIKKPQNFS